MSKTATFTTSGMHCSSCSMLVTMNLEDLAGVESVECSFATGQTVVTFDETRTGIDQILQTITDTGYEAHIAE